MVADKIKGGTASGRCRTLPRNTAEAPARSSCEQRWRRISARLVSHAEVRELRTEASRVDMTISDLHAAGHDHTADEGAEAGAPVAVADRRPHRAQQPTVRRPWLGLHGPDEAARHGADRFRFRKSLHVCRRDVNFILLLLLWVLERKPSSSNSHI
jgi:phosphoglycolate phosphatase-like HAD superfamily hydrolase